MLTIEDDRALEDVGVAFGAVGADYFHVDNRLSTDRRVTEGEVDGDVCTLFTVGPYRRDVILGQIWGSHFHIAFSLLVRRTVSVPVAGGQFNLGNVCENIRRELDYD